MGEVLEYWTLDKDMNRNEREAPPFRVLDAEGNAMPIAYSTKAEAVAAADRWLQRFIVENFEGCGGQIRLCEGAPRSTEVVPDMGSESYFDIRVTFRTQWRAESVEKKVSTVMVDGIEYRREEDVKTWSPWKDSTEGSFVSLERHRITWASEGDDG